jgi:RNA polymerase sigma-70 factor (ECF subfamily)
VSGDAEEASLVARAAAGDRDALGALLDRHGPQVRAMIAQVVGARADLDDLLQEARLRAVRSIAAFEARSAFATWFSRIGINVALSELRRLRAAAARPLPLPGEGEDASRGAERRELRERLAAAADRLPPALRQVFDLVHVEGVAPSEVAERLGIPAATARTRLFHARRRLREALDDLVSE